MKLLLLDKDGTLVKPASGAKFVNKPWDQAILPGVAEALDRYVAEGWKPAIVSNQGGVIAGHKSLNEAIAEMRFCLELLPKIEEAYFCPDNGETCWRVWDKDSIEYRLGGWIVENLNLQGQFRKPKPGMIRLAFEIHAPTEVLFVGDRSEDEAAAAAARIPFLWAEEWARGTLRRL
jgi:D-glycero-D-manno-heptose 1,7-bisphosphate phosphatase